MEKKDNKDKYFEAVGRRKTSTARVRIWLSNKNTFLINGKDFNEYFKTEDQRLIVQEPIIKNEFNLEKGLKWKIEVIVSGGGLHSQSEAVRHGISRALVLYDAENRDFLKDSGFLKRDPRAKERRKFGLKKARKAPKWSKR